MKKAATVRILSAILFLIVPVLTTHAQGEKVEAIENSKWVFVESAKAAYIVEFNMGGELSKISSKGLVTNGTWRQEQKSVYAQFENGTAEYRGTIEHDRIVGKATNPEGLNWEWQGFRQEPSVLPMSEVEAEYPQIAMTARAHGPVVVAITVDGDGVVKTVTAQSGHPLLRAAAVKAARSVTFSNSKSGVASWIFLILNYEILDGDCQKRFESLSERESYLKPRPYFSSTYIIEVNRRIQCIDNSSRSSF